MKMKMKKESKYVRVPTWMMIVFLIFYYLRQRYLVTTDNYDIIICLASFIVTVIYYFCMLFVKKEKKSMLHCFIVLFWLVVGDGFVCIHMDYVLKTTQRVLLVLYNLKDIIQEGVVQYFSLLKTGDLRKNLALEI